jgi:DNA-binding NarL/FixJ family response regulator
MIKEIRILIADDHQIVSDGLKNILKDIEGLRVVASASNGEEAVEICKTLTIDIVLMDIDMPKLTGIEATKLIKAQFNHIKILVLSMHNEKGVIQNAVDAGADGYLLKNTNQNELINAIKKICEGEKFFSSDVTMTLLSKGGVSDSNEDKELVESLTEREIEILKLISEGLSNKEIGDKLFISHRTVDTHRTNLMKKLNVHNIEDLIRFALKNKLV